MQIHRGLKHREPIVAAHLPVPRCEQFGEPVATGPVPAPCCEESKEDCTAPKSGGGVCSTADRQLPPPEAVADPLGGVRKAIYCSMPSDACARLRFLLRDPSDDPVFSHEEAVRMRHAVCTSIGVDAVLALASFP